MRREIINNEKHSRIAIKLPIDLAERLRNMVYAQPAWTICKAAQEGIEIVLRREEARHGGRFPDRRGELKKGRRVK